MGDRSFYLTSAERKQVWARWRAGERLTEIEAFSVSVMPNGDLLVLAAYALHRFSRDGDLLQTISNCIDFGLPLERAVNDARIHYENHTLELECGIDADVAAGLERQGFKVNHWDRRSLFFGGAQAVSAHDGRLHGVGDDRRGGAAVVLQ